MAAPIKSCNLPLQSARTETIESGFASINIVAPHKKAPPLNRAFEIWLA